MPNRRRRLALRLAALVVVVSALGAAYWFTRPPELVWWTSPAIGGSGFRVCGLVPGGWELKPKRTILNPAKGQWFLALFEFDPVDRRPWFLQWFRRIRAERGAQSIIILSPNSKASPADIGISRDDSSGTPLATRTLTLGKREVQVRVTIFKSDWHAFNRTYRRICDSVRIVEGG